MACPPYGRQWLEVIKCPGVDSGMLWGRDSYWFGDNIWKQKYHLVCVSHKIWHKQLHQTDELSQEPDIQQWLHQPLGHRRDGLCSCKCFHSWVKDQTIAMSSVCHKLFPVGVIMLCVPSIKLPSTGYHLMLGAGVADPCSGYQEGSILLFHCSSYCSGSGSLCLRCPFSDCCW